MHCLEYIGEKLKANDYTMATNPAFTNLTYIRMESPEGDDIVVLNITKHTDKHFIQNVFALFPNCYVLMVVDVGLIPEDFSVEYSGWREIPEYLRVLHGLYYGRVYAWNGKQVTAFHFDKSTGEVEESGSIDVSNLWCDTVDSWVRDFTGLFKIARFYDRAWWMPSNDTHNSRARWNAYKRDWDHVPPRDQQKKYTEYTYTWGAGYDTPRTKKPEPETTSAPDFKRQLFACKTRAETKSLYKQLALKHHPDMNPSDPTATATMQALNEAYALAMKMFEMIGK